MIVGIDWDKLPAENRYLSEIMVEVLNSEENSFEEILGSGQKMAAISVESMLQQFTM